MPPGPDEISMSYDFDPHHPVPTIGGTLSSGQPIMEGGGYNQVEGERFFGSRPPYLPLARRLDILVFTSAPLSDDVEVTGPISTRLWVSSNCPDTDFTMKLIDWYPPNEDYPKGFALNITDGILRCRYRNGFEKPEMMEPDGCYEIVIEPFPTSNLFKKNHRIRLDISSSNFPHFDVNPNTGHLREA